MNDRASNPFAGARFLRSCAALAQLPDDARPELVFAGRSNAGKSSALNRLCGQQALARVSKTPGRTQLINLFEVPQGRLVDLPGYGFAKVSRELRSGWGELIGRYLDSRVNICGIVQLMDVRHPLMPQDRQLLDWSVRRALPCHVVLTKADKLGHGAAKNALLAVRRTLAQVPGVSVQLFSAQTLFGIDELRERASRLLASGGKIETLQQKD
ncbi:ribosome biogenesis GTP-binding protein YihA/YsxC [Sinimarinibacterium thermocellulolyticum]|uniref:Probable GTP-binding protein EngB n=1 Tax=Sinimarinibacterium thermocellulolyticum TaxID=3170016 RepID=A0ABV2A8F0_9GAMM